MKTKSITAAVILSAVTFLFGGMFAAPRAQAQGGIPLWTNRYSDTATGIATARAVAVDGNGNVFVTGVSIGSGTNVNYVTIKYSSAGVPLWTNRYDGPGNGSDEPTSIAVDSSGNVVVTGISDHSGYSSDHTNYDYATIKYSNAGVPLWTNRYNGPANSFDWPSSIAVDGSGNVFVTGGSDSSGVRTNSDYVTIKYSSAGVPLWTNRYNGPADDPDWATAVAVDGSGNVFVTGESTGIGGYSDYATIKYSNAGVPLWTNRYSGPGYARDGANAIALDGNGNVIVTGASDRLNDPDYSFFDFATIKYSNAGLPLWTNRYLSPTYDAAYAKALAVDASGNVFVTGYIERISYPSRDFAIVAYSSVGVPLWTNRFNGAGHSEDEVTSIAVDGSGNVFVAGNSTGTNDNSDFITLAYSGAGVPLWTNYLYGPGNYWEGADAVAVDGRGNVIVTGWSQTTSDGMGADLVTIKYSSISPSPVPLTIRRAATNTVIISWPSPSTGFQLQQNSNGLGSVTWSNVTGTIQDNGTNRFIIVNPPVGNRFYRLVKP